MKKKWLHIKQGSGQHTVKGQEIIQALRAVYLKVLEGCRNDPRLLLQRKSSHSVKKRAEQVSMSIHEKMDMVDFQHDLLYKTRQQTGSDLGASVCQTLNTEETPAARQKYSSTLLVTLICHRYRSAYPQLCHHYTRSTVRKENLLCLQLYSQHLAEWPAYSWHKWVLKITVH